jgi:hypothetical protein
MLTEKHIEAIRLQFESKMYPCKAEFDALCDMALAHAKAQEQEPVGYQGWHPRIGVVEFTPIKPAPSVMRDFKMRPVYAAPVPAKAQQDDPAIPQQIGTLALLRVDAERYRWFRLQGLWDADRFPWPDGFEYPEGISEDDAAMLDAAIDAARKFG